VLEVLGVDAATALPAGEGVREREAGHDRLVEEFGTPAFVTGAGGSEETLQLGGL
jgi:hypothetical protein